MVLSETTLLEHSEPGDCSAPSGSPVSPRLPAAWGLL